MTTIEVTQKDIDDGEKGLCACCPVALAINRELSRPAYASVKFDTVLIKNADTGKVITWILMPAKVNKFVYDFDSGVEVKPFTFELDIPSKYLVVHE